MFLKAKSSNVHSHEYDPALSTLRMRFNCGPCAGQEGNDACPRCRGTGHTGTYTYPNVPPERYRAIRDAPSVGKAFNEQIKGSGFKFTYAPHDSVPKEQRDA